MNVVHETRRARELRRKYEGVSTDELVELQVAKVVYELFSTVMEYKSGYESLDWAREVHRVGPPWALALALKSVSASMPKAYKLLSEAHIARLQRDALVESLEEVVVRPPFWTSMLSYLSSAEARTAHTCDLKFLTLYWNRTSSSSWGDGYRLSGIGVSSETKGLVRSCLAGFFSLVRVDPTIANQVAHSIEGRKCLLLKTVRAFGCGKLERLGTRRGSEIVGDWGWLSTTDFVDEAFQDVVQAAYVPEKRLRETGGVTGLPFDFGKCVWGPTPVIQGGECVVLDAIHPLLPPEAAGDWPIRNLLAFGGEVAYLPVATLVELDSIQVTGELDVTWVRKVYQPEYSNFLVDCEALGRVLTLFSIETTTGEVLPVAFPNLSGLDAGFSARAFWRVPTDFAEQVVKLSSQNRSLGVLMWLEPLARRVGDLEIPCVGVYLSPNPSDFTGGFESLYLKKGKTTLGEFRRECLGS